MKTRTRKPHRSGKSGPSHPRRITLESVCPGIGEMSDFDGFCLLWQLLVQGWSSGDISMESMQYAIRLFVGPRGLVFSLSEDSHWSGARVFALTRGDEVLATFSVDCVGKKFTF
jgi:hypothetical protein